MIDINITIKPIDKFMKYKTNNTTYNQVYLKNFKN